MAWWERLLAFVGGLGLIDPGITTDIIGIGLCAIVFINQYMKWRKMRVQKVR